MNLIAHDLVIVSPMSSMSGYVTYIQYTAGTNKGGVRQGDLFNSPFKLGASAPDYTSARVVETFTGTSGTASWFPVYDGDATEAKARITAITTAGGTSVAVADNASVTVGDDGKSLTFSNGSGTAIDATDTVKVAYVYDNIRIPQNDLPIYNAEMKSIPLLAKARRIAVYFSNIAAFQMKTDYGVDLSASLAEQSVGELEREIDEEITNALYENAGTDATLTWSKTLPLGVSKQDHYDAFRETLEAARTKIYNATKKFNPNWLLCARDVIQVLSFIRGWTPSPQGSQAGPYFAGTVEGLKVFVAPNIPQGKFVVGVLGNDMYSAAAVYAPYMAIVPTQLLGYADGGMSQGFSTLYDFKMLNPDLIVKGEIVD